MINKFIAIHFSCARIIIRLSHINILTFWSAEGETSQTCWFTHEHSLLSYFQHFLLLLLLLPFSDKILNEFLMTYFCNYISFLAMHLIEMPIKMNFINFYMMRGTIQKSWFWKFCFLVMELFKNIVIQYFVNISHPTSFKNFFLFTKKRVTD